MFLDALPKLTEQRWMQQLVGKKDGLATLFGWKSWHDRATNAPRVCPSCKVELKLPRNDPGFPDLLLVRDDVLWFVELKTDRGVVSPDQRDWLTALMAVKKIRVGIWRPKDLDERIVKELR